MFLTVQEQSVNFALDEAITQAALRIWRQPYGMMEVLSRDGDRLLSAKSYQEDRIALTDAQEQICLENPGGVLVYNYNTDIPPSINDLVYAEKLRSSRLVTVTPSFQYTVTPRANGWASHDKLGQAMDEAQYLFKFTEPCLIGGGLMAYKIEMTDAAIKALVRKLGYRFEKREIITSFSNQTKPSQ